MKPWLALCVAGAVAGCSVPVLETNYKGPDAGFLVGSIGFTEPSLTWYHMYYRAVPPPPGLINQAVIEISSASLFHGRDFNNGTVQGRVLIHHLKPGRYEFFSGQVSGGYIWKPTADFSFPFVIKPGETTYVGSFVGTQIIAEEKGFFGQDMEGGAVIRSQDEHERDFAAARKYEPSLPPITQTAVPKTMRMQNKGPMLEATPAPLPPAIALPSVPESHRPS